MSLGGLVCVRERRPVCVNNSVGAGECVSMFVGESGGRRTVA